MRRLPWTSQNLALSGIPNCFVLVPEVDAERAKLRASFAEAGVMDSLSFHKAGINGRLNLAADLTWESDGAVRATATVQGEATPLDLWFWLLECDDGTGRRFAWWSTHHDRDKTRPWS